MSYIDDRSEFVAPPTAIAALLLVAISIMRRCGLPHPSATEAINALEVSRDRAYTLKGRLEERLGELVGPTGRPHKPPVEPAPPELATELLAYLYEHPGAVSGSSRRHRYSRGFRLAVLELVEAHPDIEREAVAHAIALPLPTLKDWLKGGEFDVEPEEDEQLAVLTAKEARIATLLDEFKRWDGDFVSFCDHVQHNIHLPFGRTAISTILHAHGARTPRSRPGRSPDESALREAFQTFFPNAQWVGDGSEMAITLNGTRYVCNLELMVDPYSGAFVGANIRPTEDAEAVTETFDDGHESTAATPIALLLDNKPSNYAPEVVDAVAPTTIIRATPFRGQNKAHVEGGFGLLKSTLGELNITGSTPEQLAFAVIATMVTVWGRTINHRPRRDRGGRSRAELLKHEPAKEEIEHAREALAQIERRQERARQTRAARQDPVVRTFVDEALGRLDLDDPKGHFQTAIARYPLDAIVEAVAIFEGRQRVASLPDDVDVRYLLGITRNIAQDREAWAITEALWQERVRAGDLAMRLLQKQREEIAACHTSNEDILAAYVDEAVTSPWLPQRFFWLSAVACAIKKEPTAQQKGLYLQAARRIQATYQMPNRERQAAIRFLAAKVLPLR